MFQKVHVIWELYDGVRSGIADYNELPHYFKCIFDGDYTDRFELYPISESTLDLAIEQWEIFREWESKYHRGHEVIANHPAGPNGNERYCNIESILKEIISQLGDPVVIAIPQFEVLPGQDDLPDGILRKMSVRWEKVT